MVHIGSVVLNVRDRKRAAAFWSAALNYAPRREGSDSLIPRDGDGIQLTLDETDRTHLDLDAASADEQQAEVERLVGLGAQRVPEWRYPDGADFVVLRDTEGNLFCVIDTSL
ncbi:MAG: VOC family protein [Mycobacteriales bacterium]